MVFKFFVKIPKLFIYSYRTIHLIVILLSVFIQLGLNIRLTNVEQPVIYKDYLSILNTIGILETFFMLALEKINFIKLLQNYTKVVHVPFTSKSLTEGSLLTNTLFSIFIFNVLLIAAQYLLYMFDIKILFLLILSICYMILGFIFIVCVWHGLEIYFDRNK